jgi:hypothetical protein
LHALGHYAPSDLLASEFWPELKKMIHEALEDPDQLLSGQSLRLYSKLFNPANGFVAKEIYTSVGKLQALVQLLYTIVDLLFHFPHT